MTANNNALMVLQGGQDEDLQEVEVTADGLREFITLFLREVGIAETEFTAADVVENPALKDLLADCQKAYGMQVKQINEDRAKERHALQVARQKALAQQSIDLRNKLREKFGMSKVLSQEEIQAIAKAANAQVTAKPQLDMSSQPVAPRPPSPMEKRIALRKQFGSQVPDLVFNSADRAVAFRQVLKDCIRPYYAVLRDASLDVEYRNALDALRGQIQRIFPMADKVVMDGWGLDLKTPVRNGDVFDEVVDIISKDDRFAEMVEWMGKCPTQEDLKIQAEAKAVQIAATKAMEEAETARRNQLKDSLKARMAEVDPVLPDVVLTPEQQSFREERFEQMAKSLVRHQGHLPDIKAMFMARAVFQMTAVKDGKKAEQDTAKFYAKCADVSFEEVLAAVTANAQQKPKVVESAPQSTTNTEADKIRRRLAKEKARKERQEARQKADDAARPKPNAGSGDITQSGYANPGGGKKKEKK